MKTFEICSANELLSFLAGFSLDARVGCPGGIGSAGCCRAVWRGRTESRWRAGAGLEPRGDVFLQVVSADDAEMALAVFDPEEAGQRSSDVGGVADVPEEAG